MTAPPATVQTFLVVIALAGVMWLPFGLWERSRRARARRTRAGLEASRAPIPSVPKAEACRAPDPRIAELERLLADERAKCAALEENHRLSRRLNDLHESIIERIAPETIGRAPRRGDGAGTASP